MEQHPGQLVIEELGVRLRGEVPVLFARPPVSRDHPVDELTQAPLTYRRAKRTPEVLRGNDVGRVDTPEVRELNAALLKIDRAIAPVSHEDVPTFPGNLVVRMNSLCGPHSLYLQALGPLCTACLDSSITLAPTTRKVRRRIHSFPVLSLSLHYL